MSAADMLDRAIRALDERGWCQGCFEDRGGRICLQGAVRVGMGATPKTWPDGDQAEVYRPLRAAIGTSAVSDWNDRPERTQVEVRAALVAARDLARAEQ